MPGPVKYWKMELVINEYLLTVKLEQCRFFPRAPQGGLTAGPPQDLTIKTLKIAQTSGRPLRVPRHRSFSNDARTLPSVSFGQLGWYPISSHFLQAPKQSRKAPAQPLGPRLPDPDSRCPTDGLQAWADPACRVHTSPLSAPAKGVPSGVRPEDDAGKAVRGARQHQQPRGSPCRPQRVGPSHGLRPSMCKPHWAPGCLDIRRPCERTSKRDEAGECPARRPPTYCHLQLMP